VLSCNPLPSRAVLTQQTASIAAQSYAGFMFGAYKQNWQFVLEKAALA
jgi:hypothetical protein